MRMATLIGWGVMCLVALLIVVMVSGESEARASCGPYGLVSKGLADQYDEMPIVSGTIGKDSNLRIMQAWVSEAGSWTILITFPTGRSCIIGAGQDWEYTPHEPGQKS